MRLRLRILHSDRTLPELCSLRAAPIYYTEPIIRPEFTGSTREYFRLWVVNLLFTLVSFGVFSAWAKVRKKKYFYGNTRLDGDSLDYFGQPLAILKGRVVAVAVLVVYAFATEIYPAPQPYFWGAGLLLRKRRQIPILNCPA